MGAAANPIAGNTGGVVLDFSTMRPLAASQPTPAASGITLDFSTMRPIAAQVQPAANRSQQSATEARPSGQDPARQAPPTIAELATHTTDADKTMLQAKPPMVAPPLKPVFQPLTTTRIGAPPKPVDRTKLTSAALPCRKSPRHRPPPKS